MNEENNMEIKKIGEGCFAPQPVIKDAPHVATIKGFCYRDEYGNVAVFNGITGELVRYQPTDDDKVLFYVEYPSEYFPQDMELGTWDIKD